MLRFSGPFLFLSLVPILYYTIGAAAPLLSIAFLLVALIGAELIARREDAGTVLENPRHFRFLMLLYIPAQIAVITWAVWISQRTSDVGFWALVLAVGVTGGVFGMLAAHEAVHSGDPLEAWFGVAMLTAMSYRHFRIAHIHGHHRWAGTDRDSATARLGESFYHFLPRTVAGQFGEAWRFERRRHGLRLVEDIAVIAALFALIGTFVGPRAIGFFILQSIVAVIVLELFNYIAHYGLARGRDGQGKLQRFDDRHSWNSSNALANALIFNMGRHSHHHSRPAASYQELRMRPAPELPLGYAGSILLALVPPLWRWVMDEKAHVWARLA